MIGRLPLTRPAFSDKSRQSHPLFGGDLAVSRSGFECPQSWDWQCRCGSAPLAFAGASVDGQQRWQLGATTHASHNGSAMLSSQ